MGCFLNIFQEATSSQSGGKQAYMLIYAAQIETMCCKGRCPWELKTPLPSLYAPPSNWHLAEEETLALSSFLLQCLLADQAIRRTAAIQNTRKRNRNKGRQESNIYNVSFFGTARAGLHA